MCFDILRCICPMNSENREAQEKNCDLILVAGGGLVTLVGLDL